jgi:glycosyltransferase involved in cell wall biosynthesis
MDTPLISVIVPALNEAAAIGLVIEDTNAAFAYFGVNGEILVVNDGSTDATEQVVQAYLTKCTNIRLINHARPMGIGAAFWDGVRAAVGEYITMLPGDNENLASETICYVPLARKYDVVIPYVKNAGTRRFHRRILSAAFTFCINLTFRTNFFYTNGTNIYKRAMLVHISPKSMGFFYQTEILVKMVTSGASFVQVPYLLSTRKSGQNKAISLKSFITVVKDYLKLLPLVFKNASKIESGE